MSLISHNQKHSKIHKKRLTQDQVKLLESCFDASKKLEPDRKFELARELGVPPRQIAIWYQNKRARWKNQSLELDYNAKQVKLETALAEKKRLEQEVDDLKSDLKRARDVLAGFRSQAAGRVLHVQEPYACASNVPQISTLSSCCDESSLNDDVGCSGNNHNNININSSGNNNNNDNNVIKMNNDNWGDDHIIRASLQFEELYACLMLCPKGSSSCAQVTNTDERDFWA